MRDTDAIKKEFEQNKMAQGDITTAIKIKQQAILVPAICPYSIKVKRKKKLLLNTKICSMNSSTHLNVFCTGMKT